MAKRWQKEQSFHRGACLSIHLLDTGKEGCCILLSGLWPCDCLLQDEVNFAAFILQDKHAGFLAVCLIKTGIVSALLIYFIWWIFAMAFTFSVVDKAISLITGSDNPKVIGWASRYLRISIPLILPMSVLVILRNALQGMTHPGLPLICSALELSGKAFFALFIVPVAGYAAVCVCEPSTWILCFLVISFGTLRYRKEFR